MSLFTSINGHTSSSCLSAGSYLSRKEPIKEKKMFDREALESVIDVFPEMRKFERVLSDFYNHLHDDKKLPEFTKFFLQVLDNNSTAFQNLNCSQKAQVLFDKYRELTLGKFYTTEQYKKVYQSLYEKVGEFIKDGSYDQVLLEKTDRNSKDRINLMHRTFVAFAIGETINIKPWDILFLSEYQHRNLDLSKVDLSMIRD